MRVFWTAPARNDLFAIFDYILERNPRAAEAMESRIRKAVARLADHPGLGRPGRVEGARELVVPRTPYFVSYRVQGPVVEILRVMHGARSWPR